MMTAIFAALTAAWLAAWRGQRDVALIALAACLGLSIWLFLYEIYSPEYGFRMPWIQTLLPDSRETPS